MKGSWLLLPLALTCLAATPADSEVLRVAQTSYGLAELSVWVERSAEWTRIQSTTPAAARPAALKQQLVTWALWNEHARRSVKPEVLTAQRDAVLVRRLEEQLSEQVSLTDAAIEAFYGEHRARYESPHAILLWRILVADEASARKLLAQIDSGSAKAVQGWSALAREHSLDEATKLRSGLLGFVRADGSTDVPQVRVASALYQAAALVRDGELVPEPVAEGTAFAVVWRRGTRPATARSLASEKENIREILRRTRAQDRSDALIAELRARYLSQYAPEVAANSKP